MYNHPIKHKQKIKMTKNKFIIELTTEQFEFLKNLTEDVAFELEGVHQIKKRDKNIAHKAKVAQNIERSLKDAKVVTATV